MQQVSSHTVTPPRYVQGGSQEGGRLFLFPRVTAFPQEVTMKKPTRLSWFACPSSALYATAQTSASQNSAVHVKAPALRQVFNRTDQFSCPLQVEPCCAGPCVLEERLSHSFCCGTGTFVGMPIISRGVQFMDQRWSLVLCFPARDPSAADALEPLGPICF